MTPKLRALGALTAALARAALAAPALAASPATVVVHGAKSGASCSFSGTTHLAPGERSVTEREVAFDAATCTLTLQRSAAGGDVATGSASASSSASATVAGADASAAVAPSAIFFTKVQATAKFVNQNAVLENQDRVTVGWYFDGQHVGNGSNGAPGPKCTYKRTWYDPLWNFLSFVNGCFVENASTVVHGDSYSHFGSPGPGAFCRGRATDTYFNDNELYGYADGSANQVWHYTKSGGCISSLFFKHTIKRVQ